MMQIRNPSMSHYRYKYREQLLWQTETPISNLLPRPPTPPRSAPRFWINVQISRLNLPGVATTATTEASLLCSFVLRDHPTFLSTAITRSPSNFPEIFST
eukprot:3357792-Pyramimonas_sp.AAC.2